MNEVKHIGRPMGTTKEGVRKYLNDNELRAFMKVIKKSKRDDFLFSLMLFVGARVSEISQLKLADINPESNQIVIRGVKGGNVRWYTIPGKLWKKLERWLRQRKRIKYADKNPYILISKYSYYDSPMTEQAIKCQFKKYANLAGLNNGFSVHSLRHTAACLRVRKGHSAVRIQKWLRQKSITSVQQYFQLVGPELEEDEREAAETFGEFL